MYDKKNGQKLHDIIMNIYCDYNSGKINTSNSFNISDFFEVISDAKDILKSEPSILEINTKNDKKDLIIVGDIHGSLESLLRIFNSKGLPPHNRYLFLGDLIDRGKNSCEVIFLLYTLKCLYKDDIYIIRGNHEFQDMGEHYGFKEECIKKIRINTPLYNGNELFRKVVDTFKYLPIAAILNDKIFCVHGGISALINSREELLKLNKVGDQFIIDDSVQAEFLWNDPSDLVDNYERSPRGIGCLFGEKNLNDFLVKMKFDMVIRGHQNEQAGYDFPFGEDGGILTVFSAIDYCGATNNGGIAILRSETQEIEICTFETSFKKVNIPLPAKFLENSYIMMEIEEVNSRSIIDSIPQFVDF